MIKLRQMNEFDKITSRDNGRLVNLRKVRHGKDAASIFIEGRRLTEEALRSPLVLDECFVSDAFDGEDLVNAVNARGATVYFVADRLFASISDTKTPQGILVTAKRPKSGNNLIEDNLASAGLPLVLFLKEINNPSNLGAVSPGWSSRRIRPMLSPPNRSGHRWGRFFGSQSGRMSASKR